MRKKVVAQEVNVNDRIKYGGIKWVVLDKMEEGILILAENCCFFDRFAGDNDWVKSPLRNSMNAIGENGKFTRKELAKIKPDDLIPMTRGLLTDDGMDDYGTCEDLISMYTAEEYRRYRKHIPTVKDRCFTITADSLIYNKLVRYVTPNGTLNGCNCVNVNGVRPFCIIKSNIFVSR